MTTDSTEQDIETDSPSVGDDFMNFVGALVKVHHRLPPHDASNEVGAANAQREAKSAKPARRHESGRSERRDSKGLK